LSIISTNSSFASSPFMLDQAGQIQASQENVAQFKALLGNITETLNKGRSSFNSHESDKAKPEGSLIEETAVSIHNAEVAAQKLEVEIKKSVQGLQTELEASRDITKVTQSVVQQKFVSTSYFMSLNLVGNNAANFSDEVNSVTKGR
jgi:hypothetical protein